MSDRSDRLKLEIKRIADADAAERQRSGRSTSPVGTSGNPSTQILTLANVITFVRLCLTLCFLALFLNDGNRVAALTCYAVAAATDFLDGQVARRTQTVSWLGKIMDPIMDRILLFTGVLGLVAAGELPAWAAVVVISRDVYLACAGARLRHYTKRPLDVVFIGKATTALLMFGFCDLLLGVPEVAPLGLVDVAWLPGLNDTVVPLGMFFVYAGIVLSIITAIVYTRQGFAVKREVLAAQASEEGSR